MKLLLSLIATCLLLCTACTVRTTVKEVSVPKPAPHINRTKTNLKAKQKAAADIPPVLGGLVQSDNWVIYKEEQKEEFTGHVLYDNDAYFLQADYALSERAQNRFTARGNVYLRMRTPEGVQYEVYAHTAQYNYKTMKGRLSAAGNTPVKLIYSDGNNPPVTATARQGTFNLQEQIFVLSGQVHVNRPVENTTHTLTADKATIKNVQDYVRLDGNASVSDGERTLEADTIIYDGQHNLSHAYGARPLAYGTSEQGAFAVIADSLQGDSEGHQIHLDGRVQGWLVSPRLNEAAAHTKF